MLNNSKINLEELLQDPYKDHESEFHWKRLGKMYNKSSYFLTPMIGVGLEGNVCMRYLRSAYYDDKGIEHDFERPIFMLFNVSNPADKTWKDFVSAIVLKDIYITDYYVGLAGKHSLFMYVFQAPACFSEDYKNFKEGRYSLMSPEYKKKFPQYLYGPTGSKKESRVWGILNKSDVLKDEVVKAFIVPSTSKPEDVVSLRRSMDAWDEVWDAPNPRAEIFHYNNEQDASTDQLWTGEEVHSQEGNDCKAKRRDEGPF